MESLNQIVSDLGLWLYNDGPSPHNWAQIRIGVFLAVGAIYLTVFISPHVSLLNKRRRKKIITAQKKRRKLYKRLKRVHWWRADKSQKEERKRAIIELARMFGLRTFLLAIVLSAAIWFTIIIKEQADSSSSDLKAVIQETVEAHDELLQGLKQRSVLSKYHLSKCRDSNPTPLVNSSSESTETCAAELFGDDFRALSEWECEKMADLYAKALWYEGYTELDRISATIAKYKLCMLEKGWLTERCSSEDERLGRCKVITFMESQCLVETRKWLSGEKDTRPCLEAKGWIHRSRQEPSNRQ